MSDLLDDLSSYLSQAIYDDAGSTEAATNVIDIFRDAGWLPPDEVQNESADLQLAAMALVKALGVRLSSQAEPLGPAVKRLALALEPYGDGMGVHQREEERLRAALKEALGFVVHGTPVKRGQAPLIAATAIMSEGRYVALRELAEAQHDPRTAEDAKALKGGPVSGPLMW